MKHLPLSFVGEEEFVKEKDEVLTAEENHEKLNVEENHDELGL